MKDYPIQDNSIICHSSAGQPMLPLRAEEDFHINDKGHSSRDSSDARLFL